MKVRFEIPIADREITSSTHWYFPISIRDRLASGLSLPEEYLAGVVRKAPVLQHEACQSNPFLNSFSPTLNAFLIPLRVSSRTATERHWRNSELFAVSSAGRFANREIRAAPPITVRNRLSFPRSRYLDEPTCFPFWMHDRRDEPGKHGEIGREKL